MENVRIGLAKLRRCFTAACCSLSLNATFSKQSWRKITPATVICRAWIERAGSLLRKMKVTLSRRTSTLLRPTALSLSFFLSSGWRACARASTRNTDDELNKPRRLISLLPCPNPPSSPVITAVSCLYSFEGYNACCCSRKRRRSIF